jgi:hypothetical protein
LLVAVELGLEIRTTRRVSITVPMVLKLRQALLVLRLLTAITEEPHRVLTVLEVTLAVLAA